LSRILWKVLKSGEQVKKKLKILLRQALISLRSMDVFYNDKTDILYIRLDHTEQDVVNKRVSENIVLDIGEGDRIIGIEI
jgi:hypothetical protein